MIFGEPLLDAIVQRAVVDIPGPGGTPADLQVHFRNDTIVVHARIDVAGREARGEAVLRPVLREGRLRVDVVETSLGALPLPSMERVIEDQINQHIQTLLSWLPVTFTGARIDPLRGLVVTCRVDLDILGPPVPRS